MAYFAPRSPGQRVRAVPGAGLHVPIWILGSSLYGAQVAAALGLPFAFASHFAPAQLMPALAIYRERFQPSAQLERPYVMLGFNVFAADTDDDARLLSTSVQQAFVNLRSGQPVPLPPPVRDFDERCARRRGRCSTTCSRARRSARPRPCATRSSPSSPAPAPTSS